MSGPPLTVRILEPQLMVWSASREISTCSLTSDFRFNDRAFMTLAVAAPTPTQPTAPQTVPIVILGTDALLAASPATPVQLAHACLRAGFANVIPASWGDELIAAAVLRRLPNSATGPAIHAAVRSSRIACSRVGGDLRARDARTRSAAGRRRALHPRPSSQPTAHANHLCRQLARAPSTRSIDIRMTAEALIAMLAERDIALDDQPRVFRVDHSAGSTPFSLAARRSASSRRAVDGVRRTHPRRARGRRLRRRARAAPAQL